MRDREEILTAVDEQASVIADQAEEPGNIPMMAMAAQAAQFSVTVLVVELLLDIRDLLAEK